MLRRFVFALVVLTAFASQAPAGLFVVLRDDFDDAKLVRDAARHEPVKTFHKDIEAFEQRLLNKRDTELERVLGKPTAKPRNTYALPVGERRGFLMFGHRYIEEHLNKDHVEFYAVTDRAGVEIWYDTDGNSAAVIVYLKVDNNFSKLTEKNLKQRLAWDRERFAELVKAVAQRPK